MTGEPNSRLAGDGVEECPVITPRATGDGFKPGPIAGWWPHGFNLRCLKMAAGSAVASHARAEAEVIFVHQGALEFSWPGGEILVGAGDTLSVPRGLARVFRATGRATGSGDLVAFVVRGGDAPAAARFVDEQAA